MKDRPTQTQFRDSLPDMYNLVVQLAGFSFSFDPRDQANGAYQDEVRRMQTAAKNVLAAIALAEKDLPTETQNHNALLNAAVEARDMIKLMQQTGYTDWLAIDRTKVSLRAAIALAEKDK